MASENTVYIDITADIKNFEKKLNESIKTARDTGKKLDESLLIKMDVNIAEMQLKLQNAKNIMKKAKADGDEQLQMKMQVDINNLSRNLTEAKRQMNNYLNTGEQNLSRLQSKFDEVNKNIQKQDGLLGNLKDSFGNFIKGGAILTGLTALVIKTDEFEKASKNLQNQLGLTSDEAKIFRDVLTDLDNLGFLNIQENTKIVSTLRKELGLTNIEIKEVGTGIGAISKTFEKDFNEVLRANTSLQKNFGISGQEANDIITKSLQNTGDTYDDLLDSINEYSAKAKDSGIEVGRFINILIDGTNKGIRNTDELADAQREMAIRLQDGSKTSIEALGRLGINYNDFKNDIKKGNITVGEAMQMVAKKIEGIQDPLDKVQIGTALMGTKFEDNGNIIIDVMANASSSINGLEGATNTLVENSQTGLDKIKSSLKELGNVGVETGSSLFTDLTNAFANILTYFVSFLKNTIFGIKTFGKAFGIALFGIGETFYETFRVTQNILKTFIGNGIQLFANFGKNIQILANNIPAYFGLALDKTTKYLNKWSNSAISVINNIGEKLGIGAIKGVDITTNFGGNVQDFIGDFKPIELDFNLKNTKKLMDKLGEDITNDLNKLTGNIENTTGIQKNGGVTLGGSITNLKPTGTSPKTKQAKDETIALNGELEAQLEQQNNYAKYLEDLEKKKQDKLKDRLKNVNEYYKEGSDIVKKQVDKAKDNIDDYIDKIKDLQDEIKKLNEDLSNLETEKITNLGDRNNEIIQKEKDLQDELKKLKNEGVDAGRAESIGLNTLKQIGTGDIGGNKIEDLIKVAEIQKELNDLAKEKLLISQNLTADQIKEAQRVGNLSPTEKLLEEYKIKEDNINKEFLLKQGLSQKEIDLEIEKGVKLSELAKTISEDKLKALETQKASEEEIIKTFDEKQRTLDENYKNKKLEIEKQITDDLILQNTTRIDSLKSVELQAIATAEALRNAGINLNTDSTLNGVNTAGLGSSTGNTSNTTNTATTVINQTFHQNINSAVDVNKVNKIVLDSMTANAKGMSSLKI